MTAAANAGCQNPDCGCRTPNPDYDRGFRAGQRTAASEIERRVRGVAERLEATGSRTHRATAAGVRLAVVKVIEIADEYGRDNSTPTQQET